MYRETLRAGPTEDMASVPEDNNAPSGDQCKVNRICDAFLEVLQDRDKNNLQNTITAHVCKIPPDLEAGLLKVAALQKQDSDQADKAVEHMCFLADVNRLYENALGLYDLRLALLVAQQSQKDPREYLPFLQNLQDMLDLRRRYSIDDYLGRYAKALAHLYALKAFQELKDYTVKHSLYVEALRLYRYDEENYKSIMRLYADHLHKASRYKEAGTGECHQTFVLMANTDHVKHMNTSTTTHQPATLTALLIVGKNHCFVPPLFPLISRSCNILLAFWLTILLNPKISSPPRPSTLTIFRTSPPL